MGACRSATQRSRAVARTSLTPGSWACLICWLPRAMRQCAPMPGNQELGGEPGGRVRPPPHRKFKKPAGLVRGAPCRSAPCAFLPAHPRRTRHRPSEELPVARPPRAHERHHRGDRGASLTPADRFPIDRIRDLSRVTIRNHCEPTTTMHEVVWRRGAHLHGICRRLLPGSQPDPERTSLPGKPKTRWVLAH